MYLIQYGAQRGRPPHVSDAIYLSDRGVDRP